MILVTNWYFIMYTPERIYSMKADYHIDLTEDILEDDAKLRQGVKEVIGVIISLLKDRVEVDNASDREQKNILRNEYLQSLA